VLLYFLEHGEVETALIEACFKRKQPLPDAIQEAPELYPWNAWVFEAFQELGTCRNVGFSIGQIPWTAIHEYANRYGIVGDDFDELNYLIRSMDDAFLEYKEEHKSEHSG
jgi:hypothetical protein